MHGIHPNRAELGGGPVLANLANEKKIRQPSSEQSKTRCLPKSGEKVQSRFFAIFQKNKKRTHTPPLHLD